MMSSVDSLLCGFPPEPLHGLACDSVMNLRKLPAVCFAPLMDEVRSFSQNSLLHLQRALDHFHLWPHGIIIRWRCEWISNEIDHKHYPYMI